MTAEEEQVGGDDAGERRGRNVEQVGGEEDAVLYTLNPKSKTEPATLNPDAGAQESGGGCRRA